MDASQESPPRQETRCGRDGVEVTRWEEDLEKPKRSGDVCVCVCVFVPGEIVLALISMGLALVPMVLAFVPMVLALVSVVLALV